MKETTNIPFRQASGTIFLMILSVLCAAVSGLLLFVPSVSASVLCSSMAAGLIIWGIAQIGRFFAAQAYRELHDYSFSSGSLLVILGCVTLIRVSDVAAHLEVVLQLITLCLGVVLFQNTVQLKSVQSRIWIAEGILACGVVISAVITLTRPAFLQEWITDITRWSLLAAGLISTVSFPVVAFAIYRSKKRDELKATADLLEKGEQPSSSRLPFSSLVHTGELDLNAIRERAKETPVKQIPSTPSDSTPSEEGNSIDIPL